MAIELSNLTFTDEDDIVPPSGVEQILQHFRMLWGTVTAISKPVFEMFGIH